MSLVVFDLKYLNKKEVRNLKVQVLHKVIYVFSFCTLVL